MNFRFDPNRDSFVTFYSVDFGILDDFQRKSSKSPDIDPKIEVLGSENPKIDPSGIDLEHSSRRFVMS